ncbi:MAG: hypothetical protein DYG98_06910 [Haliscomenobacteraceae bacterium CHB4]|nr:hypothetical protein [Saprospiraceae bacterium]MCE7922768.1 hypothetical protein [Haliscomenobacteraceae bacterium CHB4]
MISVRATYDGQHLKLSRPLNIKKPQQVIVIFLEYPEENGDEETPIAAKDLHALQAASPSFDFLTTEEEDIYSDADLKVKY